MNVEKVIQLGKDMVEIGGVWDIWFYLGVIVSLGGIILVFVAFLLHQDSLEVKHKVLGLVGLLITVIGAITVCVTSQHSIDFKEEQTVKWKEEVAKPYISTLSIQSKEVVFIKINTEISQKMTGNHYYTSKEVKRTPLTISFKEDDGLTTLTNWYETKMVLTDKEEPYVEYQYVQKNLGHGYKQGYYNVKIFLPKDYKFTDIK